MGVCIERNHRVGAITLYGSNTQVTTAKIGINNLLVQIIDEGHNTYLEKLSEYPAGLVSAMLREFGVSLETLHGMEGVHSVRFLVSQRRIEIVATQAGYQTVSQVLGSLAGRTPGAESHQEEEECPVCLTPPERGERVRLEHCGHRYCSSCLHMQLLS